MLMPGYNMERDLRSMKFLMAITKLLNIMIAVTIIAQIYFYDDGMCQSYETEGTCIGTKAIDGETDLCWWNKLQKSCAFKDITKSYMPTLLTTLMVMCMIALPDKLC